MTSSAHLETYLLLETAAGYALTLIKEWGVISQDVDRVSDNLKDPQLFQQQVTLKGWVPFKNAEEALENMQKVASGRASDLLVSFVEQNVRKKGSRGKCQLGVCDSDMARDLAKKEPLEGLKVVHGKDVFEVVRMCRQHITKIIPALDDTSLKQFQLGLSHSFSRSKIASDPARQDKHAQQAVALIDLVERTNNKFAMRVKEWYGWHFPELIKIVPDNRCFAQAALLINDRNDFELDGIGEDGQSNRTKLLAAVGGDENAVREIEVALASSMGQDISAEDLRNVMVSARQVLAISTQRAELGEYLSNKMELVAPNVKALVGETLGGRLITQAGSVTNLAKAPSSTIQILGAEKALFRALKSKGPTPKYGLLFTSGFIGKATQKNKGRISRYLANKIALAARLDAFGEKDSAETTSGVYGEHFREQVEDRLRYLTDGSLPKKNLAVMREAAAAAKASLCRFRETHSGDAHSSARSAELAEMERARIEKKEKKEKKGKKDKKEKKETTEKKEEAKNEAEEKKDKKTKKKEKVKDEKSKDKAVKKLSKEERKKHRN